MDRLLALPGIRVRDLIPSRESYGAATGSATTGMLAPVVGALASSANMRVTLNLASHPYVELRPLYQRLRVVALLLLLTSAVFWWVLRTQQQKAAQAQGRASAMESAIAQTHNERQQAEASMRQPKNAAVLAQAQFLNNLFLHKSFSWTAVMMDLEQVLPANVQVLNIDPCRRKTAA